VVSLAPIWPYSEGVATGGILTLAHRGVTHVRGKDCVHPDIGLVIVQDDLFSRPGERTTGVYGCAVGVAGRGARHDRLPDSPAHSRDAREPRHRSIEATGQGTAGGYRAQSPEAVIEVAAHHRTATPETFALHDAQFVLARSYGFESWPKLKAAVEGVTTKRLHEAVQKGDLGAVRALLARRPEIVDLLREGPSGFEARAIHIAVMARDVGMTRLLLEAGADTRDGIWPNRDATSPRTIAEERGYDEIVALMTAHEEQRGARSVNAHGDGVRRLRDAVMTGGEEAVIAVFESEPALAAMCPPDGVTMLHRAAQYGLLRVAKWLLDHGADVNKPSQADFWRWKGRTPLEFAVWECAADSGRSASERWPRCSSNAAPS
jgi:ankyrin repeat protein